MRCSRSCIWSLRSTSICTFLNIFVHLHYTHCHDLADDVIFSVNDVANPKTFGTGNWISDNAELFSRSELRILNAKLARLHSRFGIESALVTVLDVEALNVKEFFTDLFNLWGVGHRVKNNGLVIGFVDQRRKLAMITGSGLSEVLCDGWLAQMQSDTMLEHLRKNSHANAVLAGLERIEDKLSATRRTAGSRAQTNWADARGTSSCHSGEQSNSFSWIAMLVVCILVAPCMCVHVYNKTKCPGCGAGFAVNSKDGQVIRQATCYKDGEQAVHKSCSKCTWTHTSIRLLRASHTWAHEQLVSETYEQRKYEQRCKRCRECKTRTEYIQHYADQTQAWISSCDSTSGYSGGSSDGSGAVISY